MLPDPPALVHYTVENPWPAAAVGAIGALALLWMVFSGRMEGKGWARPAAIGLLLGAVAVVVASGLVKTDREVLIERTAELVGLAAAADTSRLQAVLAPEVTFRLLGGENRYSRDQIMDLVRQYPGQKPIDWHKVGKHQATLDGKDLGRTQVHVRARSKEATMYNIPIGSWWRIDWRRSGGGGGEWKVTGIECLQIDTVPPGTRP